VRLASINLNKRLGNPAARTLLIGWLHQQQIDVLVAQEPWKPVHRLPIELPGYTAVAGDGGLFCWIAGHYAPPLVTQPATFVQRIELAWLIVYNTYLDCRSTTARRDQLVQLHQLITAEDGRPTLTVGDFNLAPRPMDGLHDGEPSTFNTATDRGPLAALLAGEHLADTTASTPPQFTLERHRSGVPSQFRCDLALTPHHQLPAVAVAYDHGTRTGGQAFTDHSGILLDIPLTLTAAATSEQDTLFSLLPEPAGRPLLEPGDYRPHKTAMNRAHPSPFARTVVDTLVPKLAIATILDHGCGRGTDLDFYRTSGLDADGWDPHPGFGHTTEPRRDYDLVTNLFVLNVLPDPWQRIQALQHAARFVRPGSRLLVVTRSPSDIQPRAASANWPAHHDGYWSSASRGTFQKGITTEEILALGRHAGLQAAAEHDLLPASTATGQALLTTIA
jgi:hypothetical protein